MLVNQQIKVLGDCCFSTIKLQRTFPVTPVCLDRKWQSLGCFTMA
jgi:hypothetical protein